MALPAIHRLSYAEYLVREEGSDLKHEYLDGEVFAMAGGTAAHAALTMNIGSELRVALRGRPCRPFSSDLRVRIPGSGLATYPDCAVICGPVVPHPDDPDAATNPTVLVEVLSPSTERWDRGAKFLHYRELPTLRDYVLISQESRLVEHFSRQDDGTWVLSTARSGDTIRLHGVDVHLDVDALYEDVVLSSPSRGLGSSGSEAQGTDTADGG